MSYRLCNLIIRAPRLSWGVGSHDVLKLAHIPIKDPRSPNGAFQGPNTRVQPRVQVTAFGAEEVWLDKHVFNSTLAAVSSARGYQQFIMQAGSIEHGGRQERSSGCVLGWLYDMLTSLREAHRWFQSSGGWGTVPTRGMQHELEPLHSHAAVELPLVLLDVAPLSTRIPLRVAGVISATAEWIYDLSFTAQWSNEGEQQSILDALTFLFDLFCHFLCLQGHAGGCVEGIIFTWTPTDHINIRILQNMISSIPLTRM